MSDSDDSTGSQRGQHLGDPLAIAREIRRLLSQLPVEERSEWEEASTNEGAWHRAKALSESDTNSVIWGRLAILSARQAALEGNLDAAVFVAEWRLRVNHDGYISLLREKASREEVGALVLLPGLLCVEDPAEAMHWDEVAGERGRAFWRSSLEYPINVVVARAESARNFHQAAQNKYPFAMERLGDLAVSVGDRANALHWYELAAHEGRSAAMFSLYELLWDEDRLAAADWLNRSAENGFNPGMVTLAYLVADTDWPLAEEWLRRAKENGSTISDSVRDELIRKRRLN